jgi:SWI/SNF-related matrix-associated actin-dependent regulator of chromatin subfamily A protein 2/4
MAAQPPPPLIGQPNLSPQPQNMPPNNNQMPMSGPQPNSQMSMPGPPPPKPMPPSSQQPVSVSSPAPQPQMNGTPMSGPSANEPQTNASMSQQQINAYQGMMAQLQQQKQNRITPVAKPNGIDPIEILKERENRIAQRIAHRISELSNLPANLPEDLRTKAMIELRALRLLNFQKQLRQEVVKLLSLQLSYE